ncbi:hypothetical protein QBC35DRAFT_469547 [Podospora australis]|uniref:PH domain-containing protein n=1 Tax=Podospora australis TaxID=1536484 RepID=A0AAN7AMZ7_9PEZI|nr:hypothetical protein QBC35DRAFT_469547 [Podospora australis]
MSTGGVVDSRTPTPASSPKIDTFDKSRSKPDSRPDFVTTPSPPPLGDLSDPPTASSTAATSPSESPGGEHAPVPAFINTSPSSSPAGRPRRNSRPLSMVQTYNPPLMDVTEDTAPELQPIFTLLNSHSNKLYQEGYFLKLDDQDIKGKPNPDRTWSECFAQLVGTVLSLWDAAELDAAGEDGEVLPKFINLTDASIKMIESLPTRSADEQPLQNILSISTAGRNRYLLHFNSHHSLVQWTSGIRLAIYEHSTLQEAYTGALIAGKGKKLNNINIIMEKARMPVQEYVRVRFGAGVPWRRCWCVIEPPSEKDYQKAAKDLKKRSPYDRSHAPLLKGEIRFYDNKKEAEKKKKHQKPIASISDAYSAYAIYPQSKALIDGSTLLKIEGDITIHSDPPSATEGFVFIMPESHPMVSGFEMLLKFLFPTWDTFGLYGRPGRLVASVLDTRSLMFAMPKHKRYGYLEILDVNTLISTEGSSLWTEREWRKKLKELTAKRVAAMEEMSGPESRSASRSSKRISFGAQNAAAPKSRVGFAPDDESLVRSSRSMSITRPGIRTDSAPPDPNRERAASAMAGPAKHSRHISDTQLSEEPTYPFDLDHSANPPSAIRATDRARTFASDLASTPERVSSEDESPRAVTAAYHLNEMQRMETPEPVNPPPAFAHGAGSQPPQKPYPSPEMRRANNRLSNTTLSQLANAGGMGPDAFPEERYRDDDMTGSPQPGYNGPRGQPVQPQNNANTMRMNANYNGSREVLTSPTLSHSPRGTPGHLTQQLDPFQARPDPPHGGHPLGQVENMSVPNQSGPHGRPALQDFSTLGARTQHPNGQSFPQSQDNQVPRQSTESQRGRRTPPPSANMHRPPYFQGGSPPIHRKPLPTRTTSLPYGPGEPVSPVSPRPTHDKPGYNRNDDASSTASPDYASTRHSIDTQESVDRPRAGVLKTTGDDSPALPGNTNDGYKIPEINFGPTLNYGALPPNRVLSPNGSSRGTDSTSGAGSRTGPAAQSPLPASSQQSGRKSPGSGAAYSHFRQDSDNTVRQSVAWQPGTLIGSPSSGDNAVSPELFVQQRAAATPMYSHQRNVSGHTLNDFRAGTPTSPFKRPSTNLASHSRSNSADLLSSGRPISQGGPVALSSGEVSSHLSAREQEHVARVTGSPLIALAGNQGPSQTKAGLVGAIEARERERAQMRAGIGGQAVAQAIDQRQREQNQQAQRAAQAAYAAQQHGQFMPQQPRTMTTSGSPGVYPHQNLAPMNPRSTSPGPNQAFQYGPAQPRPHMMPQHGTWNGGFSHAQGYNPRGGWNLPNMQHQPGPLNSSMGMGLGMQTTQAQSPGFQSPPSGQYSPAGSPGVGRPGTPGRMPFQGQAF